MRTDGESAATPPLAEGLVARLDAAYVRVRVNLPELPRFLDDSGVLWQRTVDPHLSVFTPDRMIDRAQGAGFAPADAVARLERASVLAREWPVRVERYTEIRIARRDDRRSLVAMAAVHGLDTLYARLSEVVGVALAPPPAHVTLYTAPGGLGIGICDETDFQRLTAPAPKALDALIAPRLQAT